MCIRYREEDLGRPAIFLLPKKKVTEALRKRIMGFLRTTYGGATHVQAKIIGEWIGNDGCVHRDRLWEFEVSFLGKDRIPRLMQFLAEVASEIGEKCVYLKLGQYTRLVYPVEIGGKRP